MFLISKCHIYQMVKFCNIKFSNLAQEVLGILLLEIYLDVTPPATAHIVIL